MRTDAERREKRATVKIRKYRRSDYDSCRALWAELTLWHRKIYDDPTIGGSDPGAHFDLHLKEHGLKNVWVADVNGEIIGMAGLVADDEDYELEPLIVSERYRGRGVGWSLAQTLIRAAREKGAHSLNVRPVARNDPAIRFFHGLGFGTLGHVQMFIDFSPANRQKWKGRTKLAGKDFRR